MRDAHELIATHTDIERRVEELPNGVRTETRTMNPELVPVLQRHVTEMAELLEEGGRIRGWDPLFATLFDHRDAIRMAVETTENGVIVTETSDDPRVAALIRAHAAKVDDFVARGGAAYRESTPLPKGYLAERSQPEPISPARRLYCWPQGP